VRVRVLEQAVEAVSDRLRPPAGDVPARTLNDKTVRRCFAPSAAPDWAALRAAWQGRSAGGAEETRTPDFLLAKEALYQLSYGPGSMRVGVSGLEPETSALSGQCSNQLS
jgi:hypothetical protein